MADTYAPCPSCRKLNRIPVETALERTPICGACKTSLQVRGALQDLGSAEAFRTLIEKSPLPVVVDFWAPWCGPCKAFAPTFASAAAQQAGRFVFAKVNTEDSPDLASQQGIRGIPTLAVFKSGKEVARQSGAMPAPIFDQWLSEFREPA